MIQNSFDTIKWNFKPHWEWYLFISCGLYSPVSISVVYILFSKDSHLPCSDSVSWWTQHFLLRASKKVLHYLFECVWICYDSIQSIKEGVTPSIWMYFTLLWLYTYHHRRCSTFYLNVFSSAVILCRASNKVLHFFKCTLEITYNLFSKTF